MRKFFLASVAAAAVLGGVSSASASTLIVTSTAMNAPNIVNISVPNGLNEAVYMAPMEFTVQGMTTVLGYCVDLYHDITLGAQNPNLVYTTGPLSNNFAAPPVAVSNQLAEQIGFLAYQGFADFANGDFMDANAIQGGIWEKLGATVTTSDLNLQALIDGFGASTGAIAYVPTVMTDSLAQSFVIGVPEPATWAMFLTGFGLIGWTLRGSRKAAVTA